MYSILFRNRLVALAFVLLIIISAVALVGTQEQDGVIVTTTQQIKSQKSEFENSLQEMNQPSPAIQEAQSGETSKVIQFIPDEELIDKAEGLDPTPKPAEIFDPTPKNESKPADLAQPEESGAPDHNGAINNGPTNNDNEGEIGE